MDQDQMDTLVELVEHYKKNSTQRAEEVAQAVTSMKHERSLVLAFCFISMFLSLFTVLQNWHLSSQLTNQRKTLRQLNSCARVWVVETCTTIE